MSWPQSLVSFSLTSDWSALFWVVLTVVGIATVNSATKAMDQKFSVPGKEGWETNVAITEHFHGTGGDTAPIVPVVTLPQGKTVDSPGVDSQLTQMDNKLEQALPGARIASFSSTGDRAFVSKDGRTTFAIVYPQPDPNSAFGENPDAAKHARAAMSNTTIAGAPVHVSGFDALQNESGGDSGTGVLLESVLGGVGALIVLAFVFASFLALLPMAMAIVSIMTSFLLVWGLTVFTDVSPVVQFLIALVGLGIAIDYSLLVVSRWREERAHGREWRRGGPARDGDGRASRGVQRHDRRDRPVGDGGAAGAVPAEHGLRRAGDPTGRDARRDHAAPGRAVEVRAAARLAAPAHGRSRQQGLDAVGGARGAAALDRRRCRSRRSSAS